MFKSPHFRIFDYFAVTLTPEVDSQVSSSVESSGAVIAPTTIVCLPSVAAPPHSSVPAAAVPSVPSLVSSPALPYLALSTSTPVTAVRAITTKTNTKVCDFCILIDVHENSVLTTFIVFPPDF